MVQKCRLSPNRPVAPFKHCPYKEKCETVAALPAADSLAYAYLRPVSACLWPTKLPAALYQPTCDFVPAYLWLERPANRPERLATWICKLFRPVYGQKQPECDLLLAEMRPIRPLTVLCGPAICL
ncbi:hypothetical protein O6H91_06G087500 [Diphasiastrum complanatum]|uniref:Uncharacterized protein n=1 Tax=Diphasiastrum complanatum TaxID=34168 RepID=A0ACC2DG91_DIPCM|nr:hypothetical protein O6H91_06G087500 [Diphasiastrum complanatum]